MGKHTLMDVADVLVFIDSILDKMEKNGTITREVNNAVYTAVYEEFFPGKEDEDVLHLSEHDAQELLEVLDNPGPTPPKLVEAAERYKTIVGEEEDDDTC